MRVYFAGEHLADEQGFMEGAVVTGKDAAESIQKTASSKQMLTAGNIRRLLQRSYFKPHFSAPWTAQGFGLTEVPMISN
jgi:Flavin containing amine oxidoreductase